MNTNSEIERLSEKTTSSENIFDGVILHVRRDMVTLSNGSETVREVIRHIGAVCVIRRRREGLLCVLPLAVILSLLISTPVFSEFRYAYAIFTSFPFIALSVLSAEGTAPDESAGAGKGKETLYG